MTAEIDRYELEALNLLNTVSSCERRDAELEAARLANTRARNAAIAMLVRTEEKRRTTLGLSPRGAAAYVADKVNLTPERVSQILAAQRVATSDGKTT